MSDIEKLTVYDFPDRDHIPDGYYLKQIPAPTRENMFFLMEKYNELVDAVNGIKHALCGILPDE